MYRGSSSSAFYMSRPSIARYIEAAVASVGSDGGRFGVRFDVLSDHQMYADAEGALRGVFVVTAITPPLGAQVTLDFQLPWGETMEVLGEVEWVLDVPRASLRHRPGMGVRFELHPSQLALVERAMILRDPIEVPVGVRRNQ